MECIRINGKSINIQNTNPHNYLCHIFDLTLFCRRVMKLPFDSGYFFSFNLALSFDFLKWLQNLFVFVKPKFINYCKTVLTFVGCRENRRHFGSLSFIKHDLGMSYTWAGCPFLFWRGAHCFYSVGVVPLSLHSGCYADF